MNPWYIMVVVALLSGCAGRFGHIGQPPAFTPVSGPTLSAPPPVHGGYGAMLPASLMTAGAAPAGAAPARAYGIDDTPGARSPHAYSPMAASYAHTRPASLWSSGPASLFGDRRARGVGDIVTVLIEIEDEAEISNQSNRTRTGAENMEATALLGFEGPIARILPGQNGLSPGVSTTSSSNSTGTGAVRRNETISLKIAARVIEVLPNGHFVVSGRQEVRVNHELRDLQVLGLIRPEDISRQNQITYDKMAEARIAYGGRGVISDVQQPRYGQQAFDLIAPF